MRALIRAATAAALLAVPAVPATASGGAVVLVCTVHHPVYGSSTANGSCTGTGLDLGGGPVAGTSTISYAFASSLCPLAGSGSGSVDGIQFTMTRVGAVGVLATTGAINGAGVGAFVVTSPLGNPCGAPADEAAVLVIAGV